jgi:hypothetical protein
MTNRFQRDNPRGICRREFLALGGTALCAMVSRESHSQPVNNLVRGAVVIGVDTAGSLPKLSAAASGAKQLGTWLEGERFEVKLLVDEQKPVLFEDVYDAIEDLVNRGNLDQLVIYFAGHGFLNNYAEYWLLSKAPENPNQAISLVESVARAKRSGIPNVVFISDACRSTPDSIKSAHVRGGLLFPTSTSTTRVEVDRFLAALPGDPALELPVSKSVPIFEGIFTACFLDAFKKPNPDMVVRLPDGTRVVPNRKLGGYLLEKVQQRAQTRSIELKQIPDWDVVSDDAYIGRAPPESTTSVLPGEVSTTVVDVARNALANVSVDALKEYRHPAKTTFLPPDTAVEHISRVGAETGFFSNQAAILKAQAASSFNPMFMGFGVVGADVEFAVTEDGQALDLARADGIITASLGPAPRGATSVAIRFADGSGCIVAALPRFVANVVVDASGVSNISYLPSEFAARRGGEDGERTRLDELHAAVATSARYGVFRITGDRSSRKQNAEQLGDRIRVLKGIDPTLGVYAAYAYADADLVEKVRSVHNIMLTDLNAELFDVALLAGALSERSPATAGDGPSSLVPICPMLSQGWELLRVNGVELPPQLEEARPHLRRSLWTTFDPKGMDSVLRLFRPR